MPLVIYYIAILLEFTAVNIYSINKFCTRKKPAKHVVITLILWSLIYIAMAVAFMLFSPHYGSGKGLFVIFGFVFLIPMRIIYKNPMAWLFEVACTTFLFTLWVFAISVNIAAFVPKEWSAWSLFIFQSVLLALLAPWYSHFCQSIFLETLSLMPEGVTRKFRLTSFLWLCVILIANCLFVSNTSILNIVFMLFMGILCFMCYTLLHSSLMSRMRAERFKEIAYVDDLTGLPNRAAFFQDGQKLLIMMQPFDLIFMDLDHFKQINDSHGHMAGNDYLQGFAASIQELCQGLGTAYRMSGDEFVCILKDGARKEFSSRLSGFQWPTYVRGQPFLGVAAGSACCPQDGDSLDALVKKADKAMYGRKGKR
ncbi:MAG: GGDEF domain-containing protein [Oscillospiraceae bacterium]